MDGQNQDVLRCAEIPGVEALILLLLIVSFKRGSDWEAVIRFVPLQTSEVI